MSKAEEKRVSELNAGSVPAQAVTVVPASSSRARIAFTTAVREVQLLEGRAHFEVAQNANWPLRVLTKSADVVTVVTMFDVQSLAGSTTVTLIEGRVNVRTHHSGHAA